MREIKFRGKTLGGEWVYGYLSDTDLKVNKPVYAIYLMKPREYPERKII